MRDGGWKESLRMALVPYQDVLPFKLDDKMDAALAAYAAGAPTGDAIRWERLQLGSRASRYVR